MAFPNNFNPILHDNDLYRFAEIEIQQAHENLTKFMASHPNNAIVIMVDQLFLPSEDKDRINNFKATILNRRYLPTKKEQVNYFRCNGYSYGVIRANTGISSQTIQKQQQEQPFMRPYFNDWDHTLLQRWNALKPYIKVWN